MRLTWLCSRFRQIDSQKVKKNILALPELCSIYAGVFVKSGDKTIIIDKKLQETYKYNRRKLLWLNRTLLPMRTCLSSGWKNFILRISPLKARTLPKFFFLKTRSPRLQ